MLRNAGKLLVALVPFFAACGGGGGDSETSVSCSPAPQIHTQPATVATVGVQYVYPVRGVKACILKCGGFTVTQGPPDVVADQLRSAVAWTPSPTHANSTVPFGIVTTPDLCGNTVGQSWTIAVFEPPVIRAFSASQAAVSPGTAVTLTAEFAGDGSIEGLDPIASGVPLVTPALTSTRTFQLVVRNGAGALASSSVTVEVLGPPVIEAFNAAPSVIGEGGTARLSWNASGDFSTATLTPPGTSVLGRSAANVSPASSTTYTLHLANPVGASATETVQVTVLPSGSIGDFSAAPASVSKGGSTTLHATYEDGAGTVEAADANGNYSPLGAIASGGTLSVGPLFRDTSYRLIVANPLGFGITRDLMVTVTGPGTFRPAAGLPLSPNRFYHSATRLLDGRVLVSGGRNGEQTTEIYDPSTETFSAGPALQARRVRHSATLLLDGRVLLVGGAELFGVETAEVYDPASSSTAPVPFAFAAPGPAIRLDDGRVLLGIDASPSTGGNGATLFDPATGTFSGAVPFAMMFSAVQAFVRLPAGTVIGVRAGDASELFTPGSPAFAPSAGTLPHAASGLMLKALPLADGRVVVVPSFGVAAGTALSFYDPLTDRFSIGNQGFAQVYGRALMLSDGKVLAIGGTSTGDHPWTEHYDPASNTVAASGGLRVSRGLHTATLLQDGSVLVVGGCSGSPCPAEIYTPE